MAQIWSFPLKGYNEWTSGCNSERLIYTPQEDRRRLTWVLLIGNRSSLSPDQLFWFCLSSLCSLLTGGRRQRSHRYPTPPTACGGCPSAPQFTPATLSPCLSPCPCPLFPGCWDLRCLHLTELLRLTSTSQPGGHRFAVRHAITPAGWSWWVSSPFPRLETFYLMVLLTVISPLGLGSFYSLLQPIIPNQGNDVVSLHLQMGAVMSTVFMVLLCPIKVYACWQLCTVS